MAIVITILLCIIWFIISLSNVQSIEIKAVMNNSKETEIQLMLNKVTMKNI